MGYVMKLIIAISILLMTSPLVQAREVLSNLENESTAVVNEELRRINANGVTNNANIATNTANIAINTAAIADIGVKLSLFDTFGGDGTDGAVSITSNTNVSAIDDASRTGMIRATDFTLTSGDTLTVDTGWLFLSVSGTCTIEGTIDADAQGEVGGAQNGDLSADGWVGADASLGGETIVSERGNQNIKAISMALSGAGGGGGGNALPQYGGGGGGANGRGGSGATGGATGPSGEFVTSRVIALTGGLGNNSTSSLGQGFLSALAYRGAGGGGGACGALGTPGGAGGDGGGVIYIECDTLVFTGVITADGEAGAPGLNEAGNAGGGGGGGGIVLVRANTITTESGTVTCTGGAGGAGATAGDGGAGSAGFKDITTV